MVKVTKTFLQCRQCYNGSLYTTTASGLVTICTCILVCSSLFRAPSQFSTILNNLIFCLKILMLQLLQLLSSVHTFWYFYYHTPQRLWLGTNSDVTTVHSVLASCL